MDLDGHTSLWLDRPDRPAFPPLPPGRTVDVLVVGGGLTGLTTALLLARAGADVAVVEARRLGVVTTGNSTGKVTLLQGTKLSRLARRHSTATIQAYVDANTEGQQWLLRYCADHDVPVERRAALTFAWGEEGRDAAAAEYDAAHNAGLAVEWVEEPDLPFATNGSVRLGDQAQLDTMDVVEALARDVERHGGEIFEGSRVTGVSSGSPCEVTVTTDDGDGGTREVRITAGRVVLATGTPILDRGGFFARLEPLRSYALALDVPGPLPEDMAISAEEPTRSLRTAPVTGGRKLVVGGQGHPVGRAVSPREHVLELTRWAAELFPGARPTHVWSAQDYRSADLLPSVGPLLPGSDRVLVATGYDKWGLATAVAAGLAISGTILGGHLPWAHTVRTWRGAEIFGVDRAVRLNASVAARFTADWFSPRVHSSAVRPPEGQGRVELDGVRRVASSTVGGRTRRVSAVCTHRGGVVTWNDADCTWDCPLHGSRFDAAGRVLEGPATEPLPERRDVAGEQALPAGSGGPGVPGER